MTVSACRLAVVGCGAITENVHLPVLTNSTYFEPVGLIDRVLDQHFSGEIDRTHLLGALTAVETAHRLWIESERLPAESVT